MLVCSYESLPRHKQTMGVAMTYGKAPTTKTGGYSKRSALQEPDFSVIEQKSEFTCKIMQNVV
ncbi:hypothetical protein AUJ66_05325 [Candidatus Desantisbacteria bacterium CG1_02_38_46]|uniref:Uncharacterized protein n=1 Tax=Candidatus Desantisbacteria bacterium CG1_02_38_46 TaxID=1817893 RepID=A0A1J4SFA9_9BACT|nr:MAG: hypothetical protein AUJ66_05325 [Candidatus Desantisbacteria bacterium CG1_02_38_46]